MADRRKGKQKARRDEDGEKPTDEEHAVAKHLKFNLPQKEAKLVGMTVKVFIASEAVDMLLESKWSSSKGKGDNILFTNRSSCTKYMDRLLQKGLFHRALRVEKKKKNYRDDVDEPNAEEKVRRRKAKKDLKPEKVLEKEKEKEKEESEKKDKDKDKDDKKKKEKKMKLKMHDDQFFCDGDEVFVWIYDPVNVRTFIIGLFLVLGSIGVCLFPLWPPEVRQGVYYLSLAAAGFVGFILVLAIIRLVMFCIIWAVTMGKHHLWLFPNLMEDVGIIDSFKPLYKHDIKLKEEKKEKTDEQDSKTEKEKDKNSDKEKDNSGESSESEENFEIVDKSEVTETEDSQVAD